MTEKWRAQAVKDAAMLQNCNGPEVRRGRVNGSKKVAMDGFAGADAIQMETDGCMLRNLW